MAGGGQKGVGGIEFAGGAMILLGFIGGCTARGWMDGQGDDPISSHETACEQAWTDREKGQAEEDDLVLLDTVFCQTHNASVVMAATAEQRENLEEAQP